MSTTTPCGTASGRRAAPTPAPTPRRRPVAAGCLKALAMLIQNPITHAPIPRMHLAPVKSVGTLIVHDRASGERFRIYTPKFESQFRAGHRYGFWYARPVNTTGAQPASRGFATARDAVDALRQGRWSLADPVDKTAPKSLVRIIWP
jgi:hypothetical protein